MGLLSLRRQKDTADGDDSPFVADGADEAASARPKARKKRGTQPIDPVLPEKQRARRRLVGAVALVLAAVIGLPMVLDPEPKPLAADISIDIPSKDKGKPASSVAPAAALDKREEIVTPDLPPAPAVPAAATAAVKAEEGAKAEAAAESRAPAANVTPSVTPSDAKPSEVKPEAKAVAKADSKPEARAEAPKKPEARSTDEARARALLEGRHDAAGAEKLSNASEKPERYMVQVAALASQDKVNELQSRLKAAGIKSQTQKVATQSGERIRVRVGPVQGRAEAEKMRARLNKLGLNGTLVPA